MFIAIALGFCFNKDKSADALPSYPYSGYIGPIYNFDDLNYDEAKLNELAAAILGNGKTINNLIDYIHSDAQTDGLPIDNKQITVAYGRYRASITTDNYDPLVWMPVYMSTDKDGKDAILTLYLAACNGSRSAFEYGSFTQNGEYTNVPQCMPPSNMYSTSYMRSYQLGNGGKFMNYDASHNATVSENSGAVPKASGNNKFLDFLKHTEVDYYGETVNTMGYLYEDIVAPSQMAWQAKESYSDEIGGNGVFADAAYGGTAWADYKWPNEAYGTSNGNYTNNNYDYSNISGYDFWKDDKVWLPSLTEVGTGDDDGTTDTLNGLWELTKFQKANNPTMLNPVTAAWLRTPNTVANCYSMFTLEQDGSVGTRELSEKNLQIRPAIHLNLSKIITKYKKPVNVPDVVSVQYNGAEQTLKNGEVSWMTDDISVSFYLDKEATKSTTPVNAGEYFLVVYLEDPSDYFVKLPFEQKYKTVHFIVEKKQIGVKWKYDGNKPSDIELSSDSVIYDRDKIADFVPEIGIKYTSTTGSGVTYYEYEDILKGSYNAEAYIIDEDKYNYNYILSPDTIGSGRDEVPNPVKVGESLKSNTFAVGRKEVDMPYFVGTTPGTLTHRLYYKGDQYVQIANINPDYITVTISSPLNRDCEFIGVSEQGYLTFRVSERDDYSFNLKFKNTTQFTWSDSGYVFAPDAGPGGESGVDTADRKLTLELRRAELDLEFVNLAAEWGTNVSQQFSVAVHGVYAEDADNPIKLTVYYMRAGQPSPTTVTAVDGVYTLRADSLIAGNYTMYASLEAGSAYLDNYTIPGNFKTQSFKVIEVKSDFNISLIKWQYTHGGTTQGNYGFAEHDQEGKALEFYYTGDFYQFSLTLNEDDLRDLYFVKAIYSGDKFVKDAGLYKITVEIKAYYESVHVDPVTCDLYFRIKPVKYNLSALEWDYTVGSPFTYNGAQKKVSITTDSLANYPGLTVNYTTEGNRTDAGTYTTNASFKISDDYAKNYILPVEGDDTTYDGEFPFSCTWSIGKANLEIEWKTHSPDESSDIMYVPTLKVGHEFVNYKYERWNGTTWEPATELKADGADEKFRALAVLKDEYSNNYQIESNVYSDEFEVKSGKLAVSVHYEANGKVVDDGTEFAYTGSAVDFKLVVDGGGLTVDDDYEFKFFAKSGGTETELTGAPFDIGEYVVEVTAKFNNGTYVSSGTPRVNFKIVKADYDPKQMWWKYQHGDTILMGRFDKEQGKWVDEKGKEVEFSFEYDGTPHMLTLELQQEFTDPADKITVNLASVVGNSATSANDYIARAAFNYNTARFNDPIINGDKGVFPELLNWKITKQKLDYNKVQWGYFDADGKEHKFNFEEDSFRFTRNKDGVVGYTVGLIGLPKGVQDLITYQTKNRTVVGSEFEVGNMRAAVGEYETHFTISGTWSDPNYEDFDAAAFPNTINTSQIWKIKRRELSKIDYDGSWTKFDDRTHDVIELCNIPTNELFYFKVEITFVDKLNNVYNDYEGYNGVANSLFHAGEYLIRLYELTGEEETPIIWDSVKITVEKNTLNVSWNLDGDYPIVRVKDIYATDMVETVYCRAVNGAEVPLAYVKSTNGDEKFVAKAAVTDAYLRDIEITELASVEFYYNPFIPDPNTVAIKKPTIETPEIEYTGEAITFAISAWTTYYSKYLYISDGNLTQTDVGTYYIVVRFYKKDDSTGRGNAYWEGSSALNGEYDRDAYTLSFTILPPTKWAIEYPQLENDFIEWTGEDIEFKIVNWVALSRYLEYEVFYGGESQGTNLIFKNSGLYTIVFTFPEGSIGYWKDNALDPKGSYTLQFNIWDPFNNDAIRYPTLDKNSADWDGTEKQFRINSWDGYFVNFVTLSCDSANVTITGGVIKATDPGTYNIIVTTKQGYSFEGGKTTYTLTVGIIAPEGEETPITKPSFNKTEQDYTGEELEFSIAGWAGTYSKNLELSCADPSVKIDNERGVVKVSAFGEYIITVSIKEGSLVYWSNTDKDRSPFDLKIKVNANVSPDKAVPPSFKVPELQYNGNEQTFELANFDETKVMIVEGGDSRTQREVGTYKIFIRIINPDTVSWLTGGTDDIELTFKIVPAKIGDIDIGEDGEIIIIGEDGKPIPGFKIDDLIDVIYKDKDGNVVKKEDLKPGEKYTVTFVIKEDTKDKFDASIENSSELKDKIDKGNTDGKYVINVYTPKENPDGDKGGFNPLWWIAIAAAILAVIAIIGVIIGLATRKNGGGYDDGYGYDDYDYDDEDEDDEEEDYDDDYDDYDDYGDGYDDGYGDDYGGYDEY